MWKEVDEIIGNDINKFDVKLVGQLRLGDKKAVFRAGKLYEEGLKIKENSEKAVKLFELCSNEGMSEAKVRLADCYFNGRGINKDNEKAKELLHEPIKEKDILAYMLMGDIYSKELEYKKAVEMYEECNNIYKADKEKMDSYTMAIMYDQMAEIYLSDNESARNPESGIKYLDEALKEGIFCNAKLAGDYMFKEKKYNKDRYYYNIIANERMCDSCPSDCKDYCIQRLNSIEANRDFK
ncbi:MAG: hypothetical protein E6X72_01905 [Clostridioides difficile]|nr:hypothetical protein [Clostridioides difficile]